MCCECWKDEFHVKNFLLGDTKPDLFGQGQCGRFQLVYVVYRVIWAVFLMAVWIYDLSGADIKYLIYFTNWSYMALILSAVFEAASSIYHWVKVRAAESQGAQIVYEGMPVLFKITWVFYNVICPVAPVVSIIYWGTLYNGQSIGIVNLTTHGFNTLYVITNIFITGIPTRLYHIWHPFLYACIYIIFTAIYYAVGGTNHDGERYIYSILDYGGNLGLSMALVIGLPFVVLPIMHLFIFGLYKLRVVLYSCCNCTASVAPGKDEGHANPAFDA